MAFERRQANNRSLRLCCGVPRPLGLAFAQGPALHAFCTELICCFYPGATWLFPAHHASSCWEDATLLANCLPFRLFLFFSKCFSPGRCILTHLAYSFVTHGLDSYAGCCTSSLLFTRTRMIPPTTQRLPFLWFLLDDILACCIWGYLLSFGSICFLILPPLGLIPWDLRGLWLVRYNT